MSYQFIQASNINQITIHNYRRGNNIKNHNQLHPTSTQKNSSIHRILQCNPSNIQTQNFHPCSAPTFGAQPQRFLSMEGFLLSLSPYVLASLSYCLSFSPHLIKSLQGSTLLFCGSATKVTFYIFPNSLTNTIFLQLNYKSHHYLISIHRQILGLNFVILYFSLEITKNN